MFLTKKSRAEKLNYFNHAGKASRIEAVEADKHTLTESKKYKKTLPPRLNELDKFLKLSTVRLKKSDGVKGYISIEIEWEIDF